MIYSFYPSVMDLLEPLDVFVICVYLLVVVGVGISVSRRAGGSEELLVAGKGISTPAVFLSLVATELSAATFIGVPQNSYITASWAYLQFGVGALAAKVVLARTLVPLYHRLGVKTVYGLIHQRFGSLPRRCVALAFIVGRILASGVRLYIASIAVVTLTGFSIEVAVLVCALFAGVYSLLGGIRSVIATDSIQGFVFLGAAVSILIVVIHQIPGGLTGLLDWVSTTDSTRFLFWPDASSGADRGILGQLLADSRSLPAALIGGFFLTMATHGTDHDMVQRLLTCRDGHSAGRALVISGVINLPVTALFLSVGTAIACCWALSPPLYGIGDGSDVLPLFVIHEMPPGLFGLVLAGLLAAAMSSLDSAVCAIAATWTVDVSESSPVQQEKVVRTTTIVITLLLALAAISFAWLKEAGWAPADNLVELALSSMTIIYGALLGVFLCAGFVPGRGNRRSVIVGLFTGAICGALLFLQKPLLGIDRPLIAWPWWIVITAPLTLSICLLGRNPDGAGREESR